jgi:hypothetical protein
MEKIKKKLEEFIEGYSKNLKNKPISTVIKTIIVVYLVNWILKKLK